MYLCNDGKKGQTTVSQCNLLHHKKYMCCTNTTPTDNTYDEIDDGNN